MATADWLRRQIARLDEEIRTSGVFDSESPKVVLRTYLKQLLLRSLEVSDYDTKEYELIPLPVEPFRAIP